MSIDDTIYVSRPDLIGLDEEVVDFLDLSEGIHDAASGATEISILGGYYNVDALVDLCTQVPRGQRRDCRVRIAVGLEATALIPRTWQDMRSLDQRLRKAGFREVKVAVVANSPVHFHTKLFRILRTTRPVWFIGSANPGSERHELMVRISGRHEALSAYVDAVFERALVVTSSPPPRTEIRTVRDFFLTGVLCHKPPVQRLFTFDAFRFTVENRDQLAAVLAGEAGVEHARPRTEGFGFSLKSALGQEEVGVGEEEDAVVQRIHYRRSCIDTVLGLWMPRIYAEEIRDRIAEDERTRLQKLEDFAEILATDAGQREAKQAFAAHVASMDRLLTERGIEAPPVQDRDRLFARFLMSRTNTLMSEEARIRLARTMTLTDMPDIWEDVRARGAFETSFFEDLAYRVGTHGGASGRVVRSLVEGLSLGDADTVEELRAVLMTRLADHPWTDDDWQD
jgi:hypothetical protein